VRTQDQILRYIRRQVPRAHFEEVRSIIPLAFEKAHQASQQLVHIPKSRKRAQDRCFFLQDGLAGLSTSWSAQVTSTNPAGEFYTMMSAANVRITAAVKPWRKKIRPAKYRANNAKLNRFLTTPQMSLLEGDEIVLRAEDTLNAVIIPLAPPYHMDQSAPLGIILAVPYFNNCRDFHVWCDLGNFLEGYESDVSDYLDDGVWPSIRQRMRQDEDDQANNSE